MTKRVVGATLVGVIVSVILSGMAFAFPSVHPTGVTIYKPDKCFSGYTLLPVRRNKPVMLMDMNGNIVHGWNVSGEKQRLLPNGNLLTMANKLVEYDWDGNKVWEYEAPGRVHHFVERLPNGNTIFIYWEIVPEEYMKNVTDPERKILKLRGSVICEINSKNEIVWEWHEYKYFDANRHSKTDNVVDWTHTNTANVLPENKWYKQWYKAFKPGNVLACQRHFDEIIIIDRETKKIVWTFSGDYRGGLSHPHEPLMIPPGYPGEGNILIFDNGIACKRTQEHTGKSFVLEINPVTKEIVWKYESPWFQFFTPTNGNAQRLPNGNTLINEDDIGRSFEVTPAGEIVWEYVVTGVYNGKEFLETGGSIYADPGHKEYAVRLKRPYRFAYDYCPQLKALDKPKELAVTPPKNVEWQLVPDALRNKDKACK